MHVRLLAKICDLFHKWMEGEASDDCWADYSQEIVELLVCFLGPGDTPGALEEFLKHDAYTIGVRDRPMLTWDPACPVLSLLLLCLPTDHGPSRILCQAVHSLQQAGSLHGILAEDACLACTRVKALFNFLKGVAA